MVRMETVVYERENRTKMITALLGPNLDVKKYRQVVTDLGYDIETTAAFKEYAMFYAREMEMIRERQAEEMLKAFERMKKDGTIAAFIKQSQELRARSKAREENPNA